MALKVLITGGTGFLGGHTIEKLVEGGHEVRALRRSQKSPFFISPIILEKITWVRGDVLDLVALQEAMRDCDAVIHAAAKVSFNPAEKIDMFRTNVEGTANIVNAALQSNIKKFVHVSSVAALGRTPEGEDVDETKKWMDSKWNTHYALSKYHAEMEVWRAIAEGLPAVIINPSTIIGYGDWNVSSCAIFRNVFLEFPWYTEGVNGFVDVGDVATAAVRLLETDIEGQRFIVSGENLSFHRLLDLIADGFSKKRPSKQATPLLASIAWRLEKIKSLLLRRPALLTRETARIAQSRTFFQNDKIKTMLPDFAFRPLEHSIRQSCQRYLNTPDFPRGEAPRG